MNTEAKAHYEREWLFKKKEISLITKERIQRSLALLMEFCDPNNKKACDLGCGEGLFSIELEEKGAHIDAVDISRNALKRIVSEAGRIRPLQDRMPRTKLDDDAYDIVAALDLIAELPSQEHRLFFMELARVVNREGWVLVSTPVDFHSENALDLFVDLARTELDIKGYRLSYHRFLIRLLDFLKAPGRFYKSSQDPGYLKHKLSKRKGLASRWFSFNSQKWIAPLWGCIAYITNPLCHLLENSRKAQNFLEKGSKLIRGQQALTHVILIGKRRPLFDQAKTAQEPMKIKTRMWE